MAIFFDTHAHLDYPEYEPDLTAVIERARLGGGGLCGGGQDLQPQY